MLIYIDQLGVAYDTIINLYIYTMCIQAMSYLIRMINFQYVLLLLVHTPLL
jgi:hypothetical protein